MKRLAVIGAIAVLAGVGCGGDEPEVRRVTLASDAEMASPSSTIGASVGLESGEVIAPDRPESTSPLVNLTEEARAVSASADLIPAFFAALKRGDYASAASYASGNALTLIEAIKQQAPCDINVSDAYASPPESAVSSGKGLYQTDSQAVVRFSNGTVQQITGVTVSATRNGSFLLEDFQVGAFTATQLLDVSYRASRLKHDVRFETTATCVGPQVAIASLSVLNESDAPVTPSQAYFRRVNGTRVPISVGADTVIGRTIPPGAQVQWNITIRGDALSNGWLVTAALDLEGNPDGGLVERELQFVVPRFFGGTL